MTTNGRHPVRRAPPWPEWTDGAFTPEGLRLLVMAHAWLKDTPVLDRHEKVSAADFATAAVALFVVAGRADLLRRLP